MTHFDPTSAGPLFALMFDLFGVSQSPKTCPTCFDRRTSARIRHKLAPEFTETVYLSAEKQHKSSPKSGEAFLQTTAVQE
jgi:hypothetical protein